MLQHMFSGRDSNFQMFDSTAYNGKNLLFKDSTTELVPIMDQTYQAWLGDEYLHALRGLDCDPDRKSVCLGRDASIALSGGGASPPSGGKRGSEEALEKVQGTEGHKQQNVFGNVMCLSFQTAYTFSKHLTGPLWSSFAELQKQPSPTQLDLSPDLFFWPMM